MYRSHIYIFQQIPETTTQISVQDSALPGRVKSEEASIYQVKDPTIFEDDLYNREKYYFYVENFTFYENLILK